MKSKAYFKENEVFIEMNGVIKYGNFNYTIGNEMFNLFRYRNLDKLQKVFRELRAKTLYSIIDNKENELLEWIQKESKEVSNLSILYLYYWNMIAEVVLNIKDEKFLLSESLKESILDISDDKLNDYVQEYLKVKDNDKYVLEFYKDKEFINELSKEETKKLYIINLKITYIINSCISDLSKKIDILNKQISLSFFGSKKPLVKNEKLTYKQFISSITLNKNKPKGFIKSKPYKTEFYLFDGQNNTFIDSKNVIEEKIKEKNLELISVYVVNSFDDLVNLELLKLLEKKIDIKICENCKVYFVPEGRVDSVYCTNLIEGTNKTCAEMGSVNKHKEKLKQNPILLAYNKAYKRNNSRVRQKNMLHEDFLKWSEEARAKRDLALDGEMSFEEFNKWLGNK